ncbi:hypothetical protein GSI_04499 [Ganoderma sinense ZZ0214-1]|uniref:Uncharacterized protein n=1 Tax=Ganoderma sinense ZZ0214-1 TaxID=1077348 RepID=A0A2G8SGZ9_9APHY|nr:hypothetical protein GSI_04499 [Ganoderma sinense ZZ0214-1]
MLPAGPRPSPPLPSTICGHSTSSVASNRVVGDLPVPHTGLPPSRCRSGDGFGDSGTMAMNSAPSLRVGGSGDGDGVA